MKAIRTLLVIFMVVGSMILVVSGQQAVQAQNINLRGTQINWGTLGVGTMDYTWTVTFSSVVEKYTRALVTPQPGVSTVAFPDMLKSREADITFSTGIDQYRAFRGLARWEGKPHDHLRMLWGGYIIQLGLFVDADSGINTYHDIRGKRFTWNTIAADTTREFGLAILKGMNLDPDRDVRTMSAEHVGPSWRDLTEGRTDVIANVVHIPLIEEAKLRIKPKILPLPEPAIVQSILEVVPFIVTGEVMDDYTPHITKGTPCFGMPYFYQSTTSVDADVIYGVVMAIAKNFEEIEKAQPLMGTMRPERMVVKGNVPYHDGAVRAYKELGLWTPEMEQWQTEVLSY